MRVKSHLNVDTMCLSVSGFRPLASSSWPRGTWGSNPGGRSTASTRATPSTSTPPSTSTSNTRSTPRWEQVEAAASEEAGSADADTVQHTHVDPGQVFLLRELSSQQAEGLKTILDQKVVELHWDWPALTDYGLGCDLNLNWTFESVFSNFKLTMKLYVYKKRRPLKFQLNITWSVELDDSKRPCVSPSWSQGAELHQLSPQEVLVPQETSGSS